MSIKQIWLYHKEYPNGKLFDLAEADASKDEMLQDGWVDTPAKLTGEYKAKVKQEKKAVIAETSSEDLIAAVESLGYHVLSDAELSGKPKDISEFEDLELANEVSKRGDYFDINHMKYRKKEPPILSALVEMFDKEPKSLTKEELVVLGADYELKLKMTMKEATMISHINKAIENLNKPGE